MQFTISTIAALAALTSSASAHMIMVSPQQWQVPGESQAPLDPNGLDFPCGNGVPFETASATYTPGGVASLVVQGSAVHGGGSGQMVITYDFPPTAKSVWRVMQTWEGDHPNPGPKGADGEYANKNYDPNPAMAQPPIPFNVPAGLPAGRAAVAWNWFNKIGNREMYMKCATVQIAGVKSTASDLNQDPAMLALPTMFRANSGNGCEVPEGIQALAFKNPGANLVVRLRNGAPAVAVACDNSLPGSGSGSGSGSSPAPVESDVYSTTVVPTATATPIYDGGDKEGGKDEDEAPIAAPTTTFSTIVKKPVATGTVTTAPVAAPTVTKAPVSAPVVSKAPVSNEPTGACLEGKFYCNSDNTWSTCGS